jgi:hypothetical protein
VGGHRALADQRAPSQSLLQRGDGCWGSRNTTLLRLPNRLIDPTHRRVLLDGVALELDVMALPGGAAARLSVGHLEGRIVIDEEIRKRFPEWEVDLGNAHPSPTSTVRAGRQCLRSCHEFGCMKRELG